MLGLFLYTITKTSEKDKKITTYHTKTKPEKKPEETRLARPIIGALGEGWLAIWHNQL